jgi:TRAP-type C4-dicarboxylate transport system substrate-binding protein
MNKRAFIVITFIVLFVAGLLVSATGSAVAAQVIKLAHLNPQNPFDIATAAVAAVFKSELEARTGGELKVEIYPNGTLGNERETMEQVKAGITQSYIASVGGIAPFYPLIDITSMPFAYSSYEIGGKLYDAAFGQELAEDIRNKRGILSGIFTPTEAAAVAVAYAFIIGFFVLRTLQLRDIPDLLYETGKTTGWCF